MKLKRSSLLIVIFALSVLPHLCAQVTGPCTPYPCPAPPASQIDSVVHVFNSTLFNSAVLDNDGYYLGQYTGDTLMIQCGKIYKFNVEAGGIYEWNTDISHNNSNVPTISGNQFRTKITLFYDDFLSSAAVSQSATNVLPGIYGCAAAGLAWKANYTGTVGVMVTRGDNGLDIDGDFCACNSSLLYLRYDKLANPDSNLFVVWGRYGTVDTLPCDDDIHYIYDSGLGDNSHNASGDYSNNENGFLVLYPGDETSKMKLWGSCKLQEGDTLYIYNGDLSLNPNLTPQDTIVGQQQLGSEDSPIFMSAVVNQPITLRMQSDSSCTLTGLELQAKCCMNPGMPTELTGLMSSDTTAFLTWHPAEGNEIVYNWTLYTVDSLYVSEGSTQDTFDLAQNLNPNECYYFTISVLSVCSNEQGEGEDEMDIVYSNVFCYPYFVTLGSETETFNFDTDTLFVPTGAFMDTSEVVNVIIQESEMHVCYGDSAHICYSFPENVHVQRQMIWKSSYQLDNIWQFQLDTSFVLNDTNFYYSSAGTEDVSDCFYTGALTEDGFVTLDSWTEGGSLARAILHIIVEPLPSVYMTVNGTNVSEYTTCENTPVTLQGYGASQYFWSDSLQLMLSTIPYSNITVQPNQNNVYYLDGVAQYGCRSHDTLRILVNPLPDLQYNNFETICLGDSIWLHVNGIKTYTWIREDTVRWDTTYLHLYNLPLNKSALIDSLQSAQYRPINGIFYIYRQCPPSNSDTITITSAQLDDNAYIDSLIPNNCVYRYGYLATDHPMRVDSYTIAQGEMDSLLVSPRISTDYVVTGTDTNGCVCRNDAIIHVEVLPHPTILSTRLTGVVCTHDTVTMSATVLMDGDYTFRWTAAEETEVLGTDTLLQFVPDSSTTVYFSVFHPNGCDTTVAFPVQVFPHPDITVTAYPDTLCSHQSSTLTVTASGVSEWHWDDGSGSTVRVVTPDTNSTYYVQSIDTYGCTVTDYVSLYLRPSPDAETISNDSICSGTSDTVILSGRASHYYWLGNGLNHNDYGDTLFVTPSVTTEYAVAYDNEYGCWDTTRFSVFVYSFPQPQMSQDTTICRGDTISLSASGGVFFLWNDSQNSTTGTINVAPDDTTTYQVMVYDYFECASMGMVTVRVIPYFDLSITASADTVCPNSIVEFTAHGGEDYIWNGIPSQSGSVFSFQSDSTTIVSLSAANPTTNCSRTVFDTLFVYPLPDFHFESMTDTICSGDTLTINVIGDASSYSWSTGDTTTSIMVTPTAATTYTVTAFSDQQCEKSLNYSVAVNELPFDFSIQVNDHLCYGDSLAVNVTPHIANVQYNWNYPNVSSDTYSFFYTPLQNADHDYIDTLKLSVEDVRGCKRKQEVEIAVYALPVDSITGPLSICRGDTLWLGTTGSNQYHWQQPIGISQAFNHSVWIIPTETHNYTVDIVNSHGCHVTLSQEVTINELPDVTINSQGITSFCENSTYFFTASGALEYLWSDGQTGESVQMNPGSQTIYSVTGTDINGCTGVHSLALDVVPAPSLSIQIFPQDTICALDTLTLHADGDFTHIVWNTSDTTYSITRTDVTTSTWFYATASADFLGTSCQTVDSVYVLVQPVPQLSILSNPTPICADDSAVIIISGADTYHWHTHPHLTSFEDSTAIIKPSSNITGITDTLLVQGYLDGFNCSSLLKIPFIVLPLPNVAIQTSEPGYLCNDGSHFLGLSVHSDVAEIQYQWESLPQDNTMTVSQNVAFVSPDTSTTYMVEGYYIVDGVECRSFDTTQIVVYPMPEVTASIYPEIPCRNAEVELSVTGASQYVWLDGSQILGMGDSITLVPAAGAQYIVVGTDSNHCVSRDTIIVNTVHYPPVDSVSGTMYVCSNEPTVLHTTGSNHCEWWPTIGLSGTSDSAVTVTISETTTYSIYVTNEYGCRDTLSYTMTVFPLPELVLPADTIICEAAEFSFRVSGAISYVWEDGSTNDFRTVYPTLNTTAYSVTGTNQYGCAVADSFLVTVYPAFDLQIVASRDTFCIEDNTITLTAYGAGDTYQWNTGSTDSIIVVHPTATTEYTLTAYNTTSGCQSSISKSIVRMNNPEVEIMSSKPYICLRDTALLSVSLEPGESVLWNTGDITSDILVSPHDTTTYYATVTNALGCQTMTSYSMNVLPLPQIGIVNSDSVICYGQSITLTAVGNADVYQWSTGDVGQSITISNVTDEDYVLTGYTSALCHSSDTSHIAIRPLPTGEIIGSTETVCPGDTVVLTLSTTDDYVWTDSSDILSINGSTTMVSPSSTKVYTAIITNGFGCTDSTHCVVSVYEPLPLQITEDTVLCFGTGLDITVSGGWNYIWNDGFQGNSQYVTPEQTTTYTVSSSDIHDCITTVSTTVTVQPDYPLTLHHDKDTICVGDSVTIWYVGAADQHQWSTGSTANQITVAPVSDATYSLWAYNTNISCAKTVFDTIVVIPYPVFTLSVANLICAGDTMSIRANSDYSFDYQWTSTPGNSIVSSTGSAEIWVSPQSTTTYIYHADNHFCSLTDSVVIEVAPLPVITVSETLSETCLQSNGSIVALAESDYPPFYYQWSTGETNSTTIQNLPAGLYSLTVTDALGCSNSLDGIEIANIPPPQVSVTSAFGAINGGDGSIDIDIPNSYGSYSIEWFLNSLDNPLPQYEGLSSLNDLDSGYYFVVVTDGACSTIEQIYVPQDYFGQGNLYVPNTITPSNSDNMNDYFQLYYHGNIKFKEILIYNRWGTLVFESTDINFRWNGAVDGKIMYNNVYTYLLYYYDYRGTEQIIKGFLLVL